MSGRWKEREKIVDECPWITRWQFHMVLIISYCTSADEKNECSHKRKEREREKGKECRHKRHENEEKKRRTVHSTRWVALFSSTLFPHSCIARESITGRVERGKSSNFRSIEAPVKDQRMAINESKLSSPSTDASECQLKVRCTYNYNSTALSYRMKRAYCRSIDSLFSLTIALVTGLTSTSP